MTTEPAPDRQDHKNERQSIPNKGPSSGSQPIDLRRLELHSINDRKHLSQVDAYARTPAAGASFADWFASLPNFGGVNRLRSVSRAILDARQAGRPVAFAMGGHVVKVGCGPVIIDLMQRGVLTAIACNGATAIHDLEIAMIGATSEDVGDTIRDGRFGMVRETAEFLAQAARKAYEENVGYGLSIGQLMNEQKLPHKSMSLLACAAELGLPATVHVAIGADTVHMPDVANGAHIGQASLLDFRILCNVVHQMGADNPGGPCGLWCNIGSAVILPEVFLKAVSIARNLGADLDRLTTVNLDQIRHYRPTQNVINRPVTKGHGYDITGMHEFMLPMLRQVIIEEQNRRV